MKQPPRQDGQRRLLVKRALFTPTGGHPRTPPRVHLHLSPLLSLPRGLFRQVNAHSLSKSRPTGRPPLYAEAWVHDTSSRIHVIRYARVFPSPSMCHPCMYVCTYTCRAKACHRRAPTAHPKLLKTLAYASFRHDKIHTHDNSRIVQDS